MKNRLSIICLTALAIMCADGSARALELGVAGACETTTTEGTGTLDLLGAFTTGGTEYVSILSQVASGSEIPYTIQSSDGKFEHGIGTITDASPDTLSRTADITSDDTSAPIDNLTLPSGTHVVCLQPGAEAWTGGGVAADFASVDFGGATDSTFVCASGSCTVEGVTLLTTTAAAAAYQPLDSDLTSIAALTTTAAGLTSLEFADPGEDRPMIWDEGTNTMIPGSLATIATEASPATGDFVTIIGAEGDLRKVDWSDLGGGASSLDDLSDVTLTALGDGELLASSSGTFINQTLAELDLLTATAAAAAYQPLDSDLTSWAGVTRAANFDAFVATPSMANLGSLLTNDASGWTTFGTTPSMANLGALLTNEASGWITFGTTPTVANLAALLTDEPLSAAIGGTANAFFAVSGPATSTKTMTFPNANSTIKAAGTQTVWVPAGALTVPPTGACAQGVLDSGSNDVFMLTCDFDPDTDEAAYFTVAFPKGWNEGTVTARFQWTHPTATGSPSTFWTIACVSVSDGTTVNTAFGTAVTVQDDTGTTGLLQRTSSTSSAVTCANTPNEGDTTYFRVTRDADNASDDLDVDAQLIGIELFFTDNAANDS